MKRQHQNLYLVFWTMMLPFILLSYAFDQLIYLRIRKMLGLPYQRRWKSSGYRDESESIIISGLTDEQYDLYKENFK